MIKTLEFVADSVLGEPDLVAVAALSLKSSYEGITEQGVPRNSLPEYSCDASCDNCHCATY